MPQSYIKFGGNIDFRPDIRTVLLTLLYAFRKEVFNLSVHGPEIIFRPCRNGIV